MIPSTVETRRLVHRAISGDRTAMDQLLGCYREPIRRMLAVRMDGRLKARFDPSDIVQIVLAKAVESMIEFQQPADEFYPWLRQLAWDELARIHRDHIHTRKRSVTREARDEYQFAADASIARLTDHFAARQMGPGSRMLHRELRARVRAAIEQLALADREVLILRFIEQLNIGQTATALGVSESAVKSRQFRAVQRLGKLLNDVQSGDLP